jgi:NodT family efflux transporter outer membrane factor (OMF) lipoprotein
MMLRTTLSAVTLVLLSSCTTLGPDYERPEVKLQQEWIDAGKVGFSAKTPDNEGQWWTLFNDPILNQLIEQCYEQNLTLQTAGMRILEARAQVGIAVGKLYPQQQQLTSGATAIRGSRNGANSNGPDLRTSNYDIGANIGWEVDLWGRDARGVESADASLLASIASYDDILTSLMTQVAITYITMREFEERIAIANYNIGLQGRSLELSQVRYRNGGTTELDVNQAETLLYTTQAGLTAFEIGKRQSVNALAILLGITPAEAFAHVKPVEDYVIRDPLDTSPHLPIAAADVMVGIPADLLRRRPDVRLAELQAWAQSARIGLARADLYPSISLVGSIGLSTGERTNTSVNGRVSGSDLVDSDSVRYTAGPSITWNVLNYGRIKNNVRVQDARLQQLLTSYQQTVLEAGREVEDAMVAIVQSKAQADFLRLGLIAASKSVNIASIQYRDGATDYTTVINTQTALLQIQDQLTATQANISQSLVTMYGALGGGWQIREGQDFVSDENRAVMRERTDWGDLLEPAALENIPDPDTAREELRKPDW